MPFKYELRESDRSRIENSFTYHAPKDDQPARYELLRSLARDLAIITLETVPEGRERSLAITNLEQYVMWANKGIACGE